MPLWGAIEAGGTKFVCAVGTGPDDLRAQVRLPTTTPAETLSCALEFFEAHRDREPLAAVGIGSFGPVDANPNSPTFGHITSTPKPGWSHVDIAGFIREKLAVPVAFDTDVNAAALGEYIWGAAQKLDTFIYLTVGTGIGGGAMVSGKLLHGLLHPEMGHIFVPRAPGDTYEGCCPYHGDCLEGLASGPAIQARCGKSAQELPADHPVWDLEAHYLALALANYACIVSPQRIILGGGIMHQAQLFPLIRRELQMSLNGYLQSPEILEHVARYVVAPGLGVRSGILGALALARQASLPGDPGFHFS